MSCPSNREIETHTRDKISPCRFTFARVYLIALAIVVLFPGATAIAAWDFPGAQAEVF